MTFLRFSKLNRHVAIRIRMIVGDAERFYAIFNSASFPHIVYILETIPRALMHEFLLKTFLEAVIPNSLNRNRFLLILNVDMNEISSITRKRECSPTNVVSLQVFIGQLLGQFLNSPSRFYPNPLRICRF